MVLAIHRAGHACFVLGSVILPDQCSHFDDQAQPVSTDLL